MTLWISEICSLPNMLPFSMHKSFYFISINWPVLSVARYLPCYRHHSLWLPSHLPLPHLRKKNLIRIVCETPMQWIYKPKYFVIGSFYHYLIIKLSLKSDFACEQQLIINLQKEIKFLSMSLVRLIFQQLSL